MIQGTNVKREGFASREAIVEALGFRYATKRYDPSRKISEADWQSLEQAMLLAPSSYGLQPFRMIVVTDPVTRERLKAAAWNQPQITEASHLVVFAYKRTLTGEDVSEYIGRIADVRGIERESLAGLESMIAGSVTKAVEGGYIEVWNSRQVYIALGFLLEAAALLGIDATPMEGFDPAAFNEILGLEEYSAVVLAAVGYRDEANDPLASAAKVRAPAGDLIVHI